ncbi:MAG: response regulator [Oscillospiraceae bacterium]|nr:response regulator [Oscillospiraceae bacterium]
MGLFDKIATKLGSKNDEETAENVRSNAAAEAEAPAAPQADNAQGTEAFIPGPVETPSSSAVKNIRKTLLAITNDEQCRSALDRTLQSRYSLIYANNGVEAMKMVKEHAGEYALIILDVMMNNMEGEDILRFIKDDSALGHMPVVALVSSADKALPAKMLSAGAVIVIPKPLPGAAVLYSAIDKCAELAECRDIIRLTERDSLTTLYNLDYFNYYVSLFDRYNRGIRMDAIMAVISNYHLIREHYGRRFADSVLKDVGMAVRDATAATGGYSCRKDEGSFLIYCPHTDDHTKLLDTISAAVDTDSAVTGKVRLCFGVYADVDKDVTIDQRFEFADIAAQSVISS